MERASDTLSVSAVEVTEKCSCCGRGTKGIITINGVSRNINLLCDCEQEKLDKINQRHFNSAQKRAFGSRVPNGSFDIDDGKNQRVSNECQEYARSFDSVINAKVNGMILYGNARQGKTFMAEAITNRVIADGFSALFITAVEIVQKFQYGSKKDVLELLSKVESVDLLVIDDLGAQRDTGFAYESVFSVIDTRYNTRKPIIVTTNATAEEMAGAEDIAAQRCYGRLIERCRLVPVESCRSYIG